MEKSTIDSGRLHQNIPYAADPATVHRRGSSTLGEVAQPARAERSVMMPSAVLASIFRLPFGKNDIELFRLTHSSSTRSMPHMLQWQ